MTLKSAHVVQLLPALNSGGTEAGTLEIASALVEAGYRSTVISGGGQMVQQLNREGSAHVQMNIGNKRPWTLLNAISLARWLSANEVDIVHVRSRLPAWLLSMALCLLPRDQRPIRVTTLHGLNSVSRYSAIMLRADAVIAVSQASADYWRKSYAQINQHHVQVIERGVDQQRFAHAWQPDTDWQHRFRQEFAQIGQRALLCLPGRLSRLKGHNWFIELIAQLRRQGAEVCGLIIGGEEPGRSAYAQSLYRKVEQLGLGDDLLFAGQRQDIRECLAMADLVFSLSEKPETFGRTTLEALSLGVPVIGWDHGGVSELLASLCPEGRVRPFDAAGLLAATRHLLAHPPAIPAEHGYTLERMCQRTLALYARLLASRQPGNA